MIQQNIAIFLGASYIILYFKTEGYESSNINLVQVLDLLANILVFSLVV